MCFYFLKIAMNNIIEVDFKKKTKPSLIDRATDNYKKAHDSYYNEYDLAIAREYSNECRKNIDKLMAKGIECEKLTPLYFENLMLLANIYFSQGLWVKAFLFCRDDIVKFGKKAPVTKNYKLSFLYEFWGEMCDKIGWKKEANKKYKKASKLRNKENKNYGKKRRI